MADSKISALTALTTPADADVVPIVDSAGPTTKKLSFANIKATLKTYFDTLYTTPATVASGYQPLDSDLTTIAGLTATTDNFIQAKSSAWASRTIAQVKTDLGISNVDNTSDSTKNSATAILTNKRITNRVLALSAGSATPTINTDNYDVVHITSQSAAITSFTTNLSGTPVDGDTLRISITDNGTARAITWGSSFENGAVTLPTTTVISTRLDVAFFWNTETSKWRCMASG